MRVWVVLTVGIPVRGAVGVVVGLGWEMRKEAWNNSCAGGRRRLRHRSYRATILLYLKWGGGVGYVVGAGDKVGGHIYRDVYAYVYIYMFVCIYIYMYIYIYIHTYISISIYIYIHIYVWGLGDEETGMEQQLCGRAAVPTVVGVSRDHSPLP